ncbi:MAG: HNH endonuclease [Desulfobacterales bacterium CG23_combo_of_CG06-09_8_20_14_all_51_8]|nr:MAG: HNH endonuclease [Desulfobacterales bacterium CG23_combo_of_CG06-09_8_20_14_all_51_8]
MTDGFLFIPDDDEIRREKDKARELRASQWWKRKCAKGVCHYCQGKFPAKELTMDHIVPLSRGGKSTKNNVVPCCKVCNTKKKSSLLMDWQPDADSDAR